MFRAIWRWFTGDRADSHIELNEERRWIFIRQERSR